MFLFSKPGRAAIDRFIKTNCKSAFSYREIGRSLDSPPSTYTVDTNRIVIGTGSSDFEKSKEAVRNWKMFDFPWIELCWPDKPIENEQTVAILVSHLGFYSLNAARIVYVIEEPNRFGFAYGTLADHGESGEERFTVEIDDAGDVWYDLLAFSKPNHMLAKIGFPVARGLQKQFAIDSMAAMKRAVARANIS